MRRSTLNSPPLKSALAPSLDSLRCSAEVSSKRIKIVSSEVCRRFLMGFRLSGHLEIAPKDSIIKHQRLLLNNSFGIDLNHSLAKQAPIQRYTPRKSSFDSRAQPLIAVKNGYVRRPVEENNSSLISSAVLGLGDGFQT